MLNFVAITTRIAALLALPDHKVLRQDHGSPEEQGV